MSEKIEKSRILWVDSFKGIAIIGVFLVHCGTAIDTIPYDLRRIFGYGYLGVEIFYIINSFLLCNNYCDKHIKPFKVLLHNILRILPLYYLRMPFLLAEYNYQISFPAVVAQFLFIGWINPNWHYYNGWISALVVGWIYFFLVRKIISESLDKTLLVCFFMIVIVEIFNIEAYKYLQKLEINSQFLGIWVSQIKRSIASFSTGFILYWLYRNYNNHIDECEKGYNKLCERTLFILGITLGGVFIFENQIITNTNFNCITIMLMMSTIIYSNKMIVNKVTAYIGKYSWGFFCFHLYIFDFYKNRLGAKGVVCLLLTFATSLIVSVLLNITIEQPVKRIIGKAI